MRTTPPVLLSCSPFLEMLEPRIAPAGDLVVSAIDVFFDPGEILVPGDTVDVRLSITNQAEAPPEGSDPKANDAVGKTGFHIYMSSDGTLNTATEVGKAQSVSVKLAPGQTTTVTAKITLPFFDLDGSSPNAGLYHFIGEADSGERIPESNESNNTRASTDAYPYQFKFGDVGERKGVKLKGIDQVGEEFELKLTGGGMGEVVRNPGGDVDLTLTGTTSKSTAVSNIVTGGLHNITVGAPLKALNFLSTSVTGSVLFSGGVDKVMLANLDGSGEGETVAILGKQPVKSITLGSVEDFNIISTGGISLLQVAQWNSVGEDFISAPFMGQLKVYGGDFDPDLMLLSASPKGYALAKATIAGTLGGEWDATARVGKIIAQGADGWQLDVNNERVDSIFMRGSKEGLGFLFGNTSEDDFTLRAGHFKEIVVTGFLNNAKIVTMAPPVGKFSEGIDELAAGTVLSSIIESKTGTVQKIDVGQWLGGGSITVSSLDTLTTDSELSSGDFSADITVENNARKIAIAGRLSDGKISLGDGVFDLRVAHVEDSWIFVTGDVSTLLIGHPAKVPAFHNTGIEVYGQIWSARVWNVSPTGSEGSGNGSIGAYIIAGSVGEYRRYEGTGKAPVDTYKSGDALGSDGIFDDVADQHGDYTLRIVGAQTPV